MAIDPKRDFTIKVVGESPADSNKYAKELRDKLKDTTPELDDIDVKSDGGNTQDPGSLLVLVLGTPFAVEIAKGIAKGIASGIADFFKRRPTATLEMTLPGGAPFRLKADSKHMAEILRAIGQ